MGLLKQRYLLAVLAVVFVLGMGSPTFAALDNKGDDFIIAFLPAFGGSTVELHLTGDVATTVTVEYPVNSPTFTTTAAVVPGTVTIVGLPTTARNWTVNAVANNAVHAFADNEFVVYTVNRQPFTSDAALGLPVDTMNTEYLVMDYNPRFVGAQFNVYAGFNNTTVTITPATAITGHAAGVPFTVVLNRGEGYFGQGSTSAANTLTGTIISADRPVGLVNGNGCTQVPTGTTACDHIYEVAQPVQSWGTSIPVGNLPNRPNGSRYRILAAEDNTNVTQDGVALATLNKGQFHETNTITGDHVFAADKPIYVAQYMVGQSGSGTSIGDPAMGNMIPSAQYLKNYTFSTVGANQFASNFLTIIADNSDLATILLDGAIIGAGPFSPIAGTNFSVARLPLTQGTHTTSSTNPHGITVEGYNNFDSYIYPGGALFQFINPMGDPFDPVCNAPVSGTPPKANGTCTDNTPSEDTNNNGVLDAGEDLNNNGVIDADTGIFFVELLAGATNLTLTVDPFVPGDGSVTFMVDLVDPNQSGTGTVRVTDGAGNTTDVPIDLQVGSQVVACDVDGDGDIDRADVGAIFAARGQQSSGPNDPRDLDGNGIININDARGCVLRIGSI